MLREVDPWCIRLLLPESIDYKQTKGDAEQKCFFIITISVLPEKWLPHHCQ